MSYELKYLTDAINRVCWGTPKNKLSQFPDLTRSFLPQLRAACPPTYKAMGYFFSWKSLDYCVGCCLGADDEFSRCCRAA